MDSRRWHRVERILGREPSGKEPPRWPWWVWIGLSAAYVVLGVLRVASRLTVWRSWATRLAEWAQGEGH
jgi:hypothetical protein